MGIWDVAIWETEKCMFLSGKLRNVLFSRIPSIYIFFFTLINFAQISSFFTLYYAWFLLCIMVIKNSDVHISPHMLQAIYTCNKVKLEQVKGKLYQHRLVPVC